MNYKSNKIAAHLSTKFPFLTGVNFQELEKIGLVNLKAMSAYLSYDGRYTAITIEGNEKKLKEAMDREDLMEVTEVASYLAHLRISLGNRQVITSSIKTLIGNLKHLEATEIIPVLPSLREHSQFKPGDDVMVYIGENGLEYKKRADSTYTQIPDYNWACAKILNINTNGDHETLAFINNPAYRHGSLEGHYGQVVTASPLIFSRSEFFAIRKIIAENSNPDYIQLFLQNCRSSGHTDEIWRSEIPAMDIITDPKVEATSDEELKTLEVETIRNMVDLTRKHRINNNEATDIAKAKGIKVDD